MFALLPSEFNHQLFIQSNYTEKFYVSNRCSECTLDHESNCVDVYSTRNGFSRSVGRESGTKSNTRHFPRLTTEQGKEWLGMLVNRKITAGILIQPPRFAKTASYINVNRTKKQSGIKPTTSLVYARSFQLYSQFWRTLLLISRTRLLRGSPEGRPVRCILLNTVTGSPPYRSRQHNAAVLTHHRRNCNREVGILKP